MLTSGGVCAVLDYEIDQLTEYIAEMAQRIVLPSGTVSPAFRKFVQGLLTSTRLPSTTILLGMNYLARRMNMLKAAGPCKVTDGVVWRMLTIGLLLGSKFLDDNTFQNRSWSEVSGISVSELNTMEHEWLVAMEWNLYVNLDTSKDFNAWLSSWNEWRESRNMQRKATLDRLAPMPLAPIDTNVQQTRPYSQIYNGYPKTASRERPQSGFHPGYEQSAWVNSYPTPHLTPPSAPDSGLNTPEYMSATGGAPRYNDWAIFNQYSRGYQPQTHATYVPTHINPQLTPFTPYDNHYGRHYGNIWDHSATDCNCGSCNMQSKQPYFMNHGYGQPVIAA
ncbi:related to cyclin-like protein CLG1 [Rhynchosporium secalis]|uniref:Related to cyclin-like protein CLG1 n=1 Tax=Rhynchosporium secalis TaxID=38038 RepID=A0A1E1MG67_RHYSE|nr:related to cyclin-like protein CLG1 [Rhynchosporium secalis]